jgi:hypothetical protein
METVTMGGVSLPTPESTPPLYDSMLPRDPDAYLRSLYDVFSRRLITNRKLVPANLSFYGAKTAVILRMLAIDGIADEFEKAVNRPNRAAQLPMRMRVENQLLYEFFANGLSALESFGFGSYYLGVGIEGKKFHINKKRRSITPKAVLESFKNFAPTDKFTVELEKSMNSRERVVIKAMRNMLLHTVDPGRTIGLDPNAPHIIDLDQWYKGDWRRVWGGSNLPAPALKFTLEPNALIKQRDWIDGQLDLLSTDLCDLASAYGFK